MPYKKLPSRSVPQDISLLMSQKGVTLEIMDINIPSINLKIHWK